MSPLYEYECAQCGIKFDKLVSMSERRQLQTCPTCGALQGRLCDVPSSIGRRALFDTRLRRKWNRVDEWDPALRKRRRPAADLVRDPDGAIRIRYQDKVTRDEVEDFAARRGINIAPRR